MTPPREQDPADRRPDDAAAHTRDPFLDRANVDAFVAEQLANRDLGYRKKGLSLVLSRFVPRGERLNTQNMNDRAGTRQTSGPSYSYLKRMARISTSGSLTRRAGREPVLA